MKFKVLFVRKRELIYVLLLIIILLLFIVYLKTNNTKDTFSNTYFTSQKDTYKLDLTGDAKEDILDIITSDNGKYSLVVNCNKDSIALQAPNNLESFGDAIDYWPSSLNFIDINRDNIPEILYQAGTGEHAAIQHIYSYKDGNFNSLLSKYNNILGILDLSNNRTPKIISGSISKDSIKFWNFVYINESLSPFTYTEEIVLKDSIVTFISVITTMDKDKFEEYLKTNIYEDINQKSLNTLESMSSCNNPYIFQNGFFKDVKSNKDGIPIEIEFTCSFRQLSQSNDNEYINCTYKILFKICDNAIYKIADINKL